MKNTSPVSQPSPKRKHDAQAFYVLDAPSLCGVEGDTAGRLGKSRVRTDCGAAESGAAQLGGSPAGGLVCWVVAFDEPFFPSLTLVKLCDLDSGERWRKRLRALRARASVKTRTTLVKAAPACWHYCRSLPHIPGTTRILAHRGLRDFLADL